MGDYLPHSDRSLEVWTRRFVRGVSPSPEHPDRSPAQFGLTAAQVAELEAAQRAFAAALALALDPVTRTSPAVRGKDTARGLMIPLFRSAAQAVRANAATSDAQRERLGLTPLRKRARLAAVPRVAPVVTLTPCPGSTVRVCLSEPTGGRRGRPGRPTEAKGARWFYHVGVEAPSQRSDWTFGGLTIETRLTVTIPDAAAGETVWFTAGWFNERLTNGPFCTAVETRVFAGGSTLNGGAVLPMCGRRLPSVETTEETTDDAAAMRVAA